MERADKDLAFMLKYENVAWYEDGKVRVLDRRVYPAKVEFVICESTQEVAKAIKDMKSSNSFSLCTPQIGNTLSYCAWNA